MEPICKKKKQELEKCYDALEKRLRYEENELCRVATLAWMNIVAKKFGGRSAGHETGRLIRRPALRKLRAEPA